MRTGLSYRAVVMAVGVIFLAAASARAAEFRVKSGDDVVEAMRKAQPGDELVMADGSWKAQEIIFSGKGAPDKPITLRAQTPGKVTLDDGSTLAIDGEHLVVSGLLFTDSKGTDTLVELKGADNRFTESAIIAPSRGGRFVHFNGGRRNRLDHCYIEGHAPREVTVQVEVEASGPNEHRIDHNHFGPRPPLGGNGGEIMRVGYSHQSLRNSRTIVEHNLFDRCDGEIEIISSKSCENVYRYNTFRNSEGCLTLRHGDRNIVDGNFFFGNGRSGREGGGKPTGGIRVIGDGHVITNNYFERTSGIAGGVIVLTCGIPDSPLKGYWQIKKALVAHNTFVNNSAPCILLSAGHNQRGRTLLPENVTIANNLMIAPENDERAKQLVAGQQGSSFTWIGNLASGATVGVESASSGIQIADLKVTRGEDGITRPSGSSPARGAAKVDLAIKTDIEGQPRPAGKSDVGCDQQSDATAINKPLTASDVGPNWRIVRAAATPAPGAQIAAAEAHFALFEAQIEKPAEHIVLKNDHLTASLNLQDRVLTLRSATGWSAQSLSLCPQITESGGLAIAQVQHTDPLGTAQAIELKSEGGEQRIWLHKDHPFLFTKVHLRASGATDGDLKNIIPISIKLSPAKTSAQKLRLFGSDGPGPADKGKTSYVFLAAVEPNSNKGVVSGWVTHERASGIVQMKIDGGMVVQPRSEYGRNPLSLAQEYPGETFAIGFFDDARIGLEQFADVTAKVNDIKLPPVPNGYSTWYHARASDQKRMAQLAEFAKQERLNEYGLDFLQIDDGWQIQRRDFTTHKSSGAYPDGMKKTADAIKANGFTAGLWITPFGWHANDERVEQGKPMKTPNNTVLKDHRDWFVKTRDGKPYAVRWAWDCLDMSHPKARKFLADVIGRMTHEWGYKLLKIDGLWAGMACSILYPSPEYRDDGWGDAVFYDKNKTNQEVYRDGLKLVREAAGKDVFLLGCNIAQNMRTMGASVGLVEAMRVGPDIKADWGAVVRCARPASILYFWNGRVWHNDPDCLMLRDPLTLENGQAWASWIAISGQMNLVSEWLPDLPAEKFDVYKRTIPNHHNLHARPVDIFDRDLPRIWHLTVGEGNDRRDLVAMFNWNTPKQPSTRKADGLTLEEPTQQKEAKGPTGPITVKLDLAQLGIPGADQPFVGFDYWASEFVPEFSTSKEFRLEPGACKVLAIKKKSDRPALISTSRHISQGIVDLTYVRWHNDQHTLRGKSRLVGGDDYEVRIDSAGAKLESAAVGGDEQKAGVTASGKQDGSHVRVTLKSPVTREVEWEVRFAK